ncbi:unnamed protein product [Caenorhabditis auriculariae]|uniref:DZF domain-containing protein n=1 Tax=Caenorhabditis auriculariae TaxID=2777116 RepID=A0A8S1GPV9_9PELO|nr:unnamed protein product [Caenorhabditis auriculariae]
MYGFQNNYGSYPTYSNPNGYSLQQSSQQQTQQAQQQSSVFGTTPSAAAVAAAATSQYPYSSGYGYGAQSANASSTSAAAAYAQAQVASRMADAYSSIASGLTSAYPGYASQSSVPGGNYFRSTAVNTNKALSSSAMSTATKNLSASAGYPYDPAVIAAASSLLQSKSAPGNMWNKKNTFPNKTYAGGGGPKRFNQNQSAPKDVQQFYCELCKVSCAGQLTYKEHLEGQKHKKKQALVKGSAPQSLPKNKVSFRCDLCNVTCTGQDTYNAHVRGAKHVKTLTLCKKLGKPIPSTEPTIIPPSELGGTIPPVAHQSAIPGAPIPTVGVSKRVVGISTVNFVGGSKLSSTGQLETKKAAVAEAVGSAGKLVDATANAVKAQPQDIQALIAAEQNVQPVGEEYIDSERDPTGKLLQYICKLCDCRFSDPNAKEIHLKGRRHRLQYKSKVDPTLEVDMRNNNNKRQTRNDPRAARGRPAPAIPPPIPLRGMWFGPAPFESRRTEPIEERYLQAKHAAIYPVDDVLTGIETLVKSAEETLRKVSDELEKENKPVSEVKEEEGVAAPQPERILKGVMRVGILSKGLVLNFDEIVDLVVMCTPVPTLELVDKVQTLFEKLSESTNVERGVSLASFVVSSENSKLKCRISLTSSAIRTDQSDPVGNDVKCVDKLYCLEALAQLRHAKWFQARCTYLQSCSITLRILREIRNRFNVWKPLSDWMCELLVEKILTSNSGPLPPSDAFRRVMEAFSSGILSQSGIEITDPCEKEKTNPLQSLTKKQKDDLTVSANEFIRLIAFNQFYKVLGMERLPDVRPSITSDRKRPNEGSVNGDEVKKDKKDGDEEMPEEAPTAV